MTQLTGKDVQVIIGGYDLTGDHNRVVLADSRNVYDVTAFGDNARRFIVGARSTHLTHDGYLNPETNHAHPVLKDMAVGGVVSILLERMGLAYSLPVTQEHYRSHAKYGGYVPFSAAFATREQVGGWGDLLQGAVSFTDSFTGSIVDGGVETSNGGAVYVHVLNATLTDTYTFTVEGSTTGAFSGEESVLVTAALNGDTLDSERIAVSGSIPRYVRAKAARTGSAADMASVVITLVRF